ncbi:MAG: outer membrane beta-barrel protein [Bacteroidota bacterium]
MRILILVYLITSSSAFGQSWGLGITGGPSWSRINASNITNEESRTGYHIGLYGNKHFSQKFSLQGNISYTALGTKYERLPLNNSGNRVKWEYELNYLILPVSLNYQPHQLITFGTGVYSGFLLAFNARRESRFTNIVESPNRSNLRAQDFGYHFYLSLNYRNTSFGIKYIRAFSELPNSQLAERLISQARNSAIQVSVSYLVFQKGRKDRQ